MRCRSANCDFEAQGRFNGHCCYKRLLSQDGSMTKHGDWCTSAPMDPCPHNFKLLDKINNLNYEADLLKKHSQYLCAALVTIVTCWGLLKLK